MIKIKLAVVKLLPVKVAFGLNDIKVDVEEAPSCFVHQSCQKVKQETCLENLRSRSRQLSEAGNETGSLRGSRAVINRAELEVVLLCPCTR